MPIGKAKKPKATTAKKKPAAKGKQAEAKAVLAKMKAKKDADGCVFC